MKFPFPIGIFQQNQGKLISGRFGSVTELTWEDGIPIPIVELQRSEVVYIHDPSTSITMSKTPFIRKGLT